VNSIRLAARTAIPIIGLVGSFLWLRESPPAAADLREWSPDDHDHADEKTRLASGAQAAPAASGSKDDGNRVLIETTWRSQCATCHGFVGHGDGPNGPAVKATDLTKVDWQTNRTDMEIAQSIVSGKGRMPKFDLPPNVVAGLVMRIRSSKGR
jgi:mono/diheme cytochrome c family protein